MIYKFPANIKPTDPIYNQLKTYYQYGTQIRRITPTSLHNETVALSDFIRFTDLKDIRKVSNKQILGWIEHLAERGVSGRTANWYVGLLKTFLSFCREDNIRMPKLKIWNIPKVKEKPARRNYFFKDQVVYVLSVADRREWLMIKICFDAGLRISELVKLQLTDFYNCKIRVVGKGDKERWVMISEETHLRLEDWIKRENIVQFIFPGKHKGEHITSCAARRAMQKTFEKAGITNMCPHDLRRSYATDLNLLKVDKEQIQVGMGHSSIKTTEDYIAKLIGSNVEEMYKIKFKDDNKGLR